MAATTNQNKCSRNVVELEHYIAIISGLELKICFSDRNFSLLLILFTTESAIVYPDIFSSSIHPKYFTMECGLICISPYFEFSHKKYRLGFVIAKMDT